MRRAFEASKALPPEPPGEGTPPPLPPRHQSLPSPQSKYAALSMFQASRSMFEKATQPTVVRPNAQPPTDRPKPKTPSFTAQVLGSVVKPSTPPKLPMKQVAAIAPMLAAKAVTVARDNPKATAAVASASVNALKAQLEASNNAARPAYKPTVISPKPKATLEEQAAAAVATVGVHALKSQLEQQLHFGAPPPTVVRPSSTYTPPLSPPTQHHTPPKPTARMRTAPPPPGASKPSRPPPPRRTPTPTFRPDAVAVYDFAGADRDELGLRLGEGVSIEKVVDAEWLACISEDGRRGIVPRIYLDVKVPLSPPSSPVSSSSEASGRASSATSRLSGPRARALHGYEGAVGDLSFAAGEMIQLCARRDADWIEGQIGGRYGLFPANFVEILEDLPVVAAAPVPVEDNTRKALFDYASQEAGDLALRTGERVTVEGWMGGEWLVGQSSDGRRGIFPANFVSDPPRHLPQITLPPEEAQPPSSPTARYAVAEFDFHGTEAGDLYFEAGDRICVTEEQGPDWLKGRVCLDLSSSRKLPEGLFPRNFVRFE